MPIQDEFIVPKRLKRGWNNEYFKYFKIDENDVVLDLGATKGDMTSLCLEVPGTICYAVEASNFNSRILKESLESWNEVLGEKRFFPICRAITGDNTGKLVKIDTNIAGGTRWKTLNCIAIDERSSISKKEAISKDEYVETISFMDLIKENGISRIDFMKMDIEGSEYSIFRNKESFEFILNKVKKITIEFHLQYLREVLGCTPEKAAFRTNKIIDKFKKHGFKVYTNPRTKYDKIDSLEATSQTDCMDLWAWR